MVETEISYKTKTDENRIEAYIYLVIHKSDQMI